MVKQMLSGRRACRLIWIRRLNCQCRRRWSTEASATSNGARGHRIVMERVREVYVSSPLRLQARLDERSQSIHGRCLIASTVVVGGVH